MRTVIRDGMVIDPKNQVCSQLNVVIENDKITAITREKVMGDLEIDASGLVVAPGFVDIHMHEDSYDSKNDAFNIDIFARMLRMGVTTAIGGNCGKGPESPDLYLEAVGRLGTPVNVGLLVPHGTLRQQLGVTDKYAPASQDSIVKMKEKALYYLNEGCLGISFGIRYIPGLTPEEIATVAGAARESKKIVAAHIREDAQNVLTAAKEFIDAGEKSEVPLQISHIGSMAAFGQMNEMLAYIDDCCINRGLDIAADCYPYNAFSTRLGETTYDEGFTHRYQKGYECIELAEGEYKGQRLNEELYYRLRKEDPEVLTIAHVMKEEEVDLAITHPRVIVASDGLLNNSQGHPRASGTFPRFIKHFVREKKLLNLYDAIAKITYLPAKRFGLNKGALSIGDAADIVIFDYNSIADTATFEAPVSNPLGIKYVFVNGQTALSDQRIIKDNLGGPIRK